MVHMGNWLIERRLSQVATRLKTLRAELAVIDEQMIHLGDDADDQEIRALVSETAGASFEARDARRHVDAHAKHRAKVIEEIISLERRQDELLARDANDTGHGRTTSEPAPGAVAVDTTGLTIEQVVAQIVAMAEVPR